MVFYELVRKIQEDFYLREVGILSFIISKFKRYSNFGD
jgi:hypothetical protein